MKGLKQELKLMNYLTVMNFKRVNSSPKFKDYYTHYGQISAENVFLCGLFEDS